MIVASTLASLVAAMELDGITDFIGIPLLLLFVGLLVLLDLVRLDDTPDSTTATLAFVRRFHARRRQLRVATLLAGVGLLAVVVARLLGLTS